jgi:hypothetical protein
MESYEFIPCWPLCDENGVRYPLLPERSPKLVPAWDDLKFDSSHISHLSCFSNLLDLALKLRPNRHVQRHFLESWSRTIHDPTSQQIASLLTYILSRLFLMVDNKILVDDLGYPMENDDDDFL